LISTTLSDSLNALIFAGIAEMKAINLPDFATRTLKIRRMKFQMSKVY
jgi:hypothetical protein